MIIDKHSMNHETEHPLFCEIVKIGARRGVYLSQHNALYLIHMEGDERATKHAAGIVQRTYELDGDYREEFTKEYSDLRRKGALKIGSRPIKTVPANKKLAQKDIDSKKLRKGLPEGDATAPIKSGHKSVHIKIAEGEEDTTACLCCGKSMKPRQNTTEPYWCASCAKNAGHNRPIFHIGSEKE